MLTTLLILAALLAAGFFVEVIAASSAPVGYQDETGFHFGPEATNAKRTVRVEATETEEAFADGLCLNPT